MFHASTRVSKFVFSLNNPDVAQTYAVLNEGLAMSRFRRACILDHTNDTMTAAGITVPPNEERCNGARCRADHAGGHKFTHPG